MPQAWALPTSGTSDLTLSGAGNLIATRTATVSTGWPSAVATEYFSTGKYYWEVVFTALNATSNNATIGIANTSFSAASGSAGDFIGDVTGGVNSSIGFASNASVFYGGASSTTYASYAANNVIGVALDLTNLFIWWRVGSAGSPGNWNNNSANNPSTPSGGFAINTTVTASAVGPACATTNAAATGDSFTGFFAQNSWVNSAPSGFGPFDAAAATCAHTLSMLGVGCGINMIGWTPALLRSPLPILGAVVMRFGKAVGENATISRRSLLTGHNRSPKL